MPSPLLPPDTAFDDFALGRWLDEGGRDLPDEPELSVPAPAPSARPGLPAE